MNTTQKIKIIKEISPATNFIINGDIKNVEQANEMHDKYQFDGAMIGRGVFGMPWAFESLSKSVSPKKIELASLQNRWPDSPLAPLQRRGGLGPDLEVKLEIMLEHTKLFEEKLGDIKSFAIMKKHYKAYVNGFEGAAELRAELFESNNYEEVEKVVRGFLSKL